MESPLQKKSYRRFLNPLLVAASAAVIFQMYHGWGNTTEVATYGHSALNWMTDLWKSARIYGGTTLSFGWLVPVLTLTLIWRDRATLRSLKAKASGWGLALVVLALTLHWMGLRAQQTRLSLLALVLLIAAIPFYLYGGSIARRLVYPIGLMVFCVPLNFLDVLTFPLMRFAAALAGGLLTGLGLAVSRQGSMVIPQAEPGVRNELMPFDAADAAGGIGMLLILLLGAAFWLGWQQRAWKARIILLAMVPIFHVVANALRLLILFVLQTAAGAELARNVNDRAARWLVTAITVALFLLLDYLMRSWNKERLWKLLQPEPPSIG
jgi:exosortase